MEYLVCAKEMKACDGGVIRHYGVPSLVLMERAALALTELLRKKNFDLKRVLVVAGSGNNGGDGFAVARILTLQGIATDLWFVGNPEHLTEEAALQKQICENYGVPFVRNLKEHEYTTIVDAIFGSGLSREVTGENAKIMEEINAFPAKVLSVDIPSGISSDDGSVLGTAVKAEVTGALAFRKIGHLFASEYCGETVLLDIGITKEGFLGDVPSVFTVGKEVFSWIPERKMDSNKGTYGKAGLIAGSRNMCGAAYLSGKAAYLMGTGLVRVLTEECNRNILQTLLPEAILGTMDHFQEETVKDLLNWSSAVGIGPGLSMGKEQEALVEQVLKNIGEKPLVLDADALNILSNHLEWLKEGNGLHILTPHMGEMARLTGKCVEEIRKNRISIAKTFAKEMGVILVLKDARTVVTDGEKVYINETGNHGMATGGSGDVLTGILTGLLAQGTEPYRASVLGVYLHGLAGDEARERKGAHGLLSTDILDSLPVVMKEGQKHESAL